MKNGANITFDTLPAAVAELLQLNRQLLERVTALEAAASGKQSDELLTRAQTAKLLDIDASTLHAWAKKGKLIPVALSGRIYYKRSAIDAALKPLTEKKCTIR